MAPGGGAQDGDIATAQRLEPGDHDRVLELFGDNGADDRQLFVPSATQDRVNDIEMIVAGGDAGRQIAVAVPYQLSSNPVTRTFRV